MVLPLVLTACGSSTPNPVASNNPALQNLSTQTYEVGKEITALVFTNTGANPAADANGCRIRPDLPSGLSLSRTANGNSCQITGTPEAPSGRVTYTVTATNSSGNSQATVSIAVTGDAPTAPVLRNADNQTFTVGTEIMPVIFTNTGGAVTGGDASADGCAVDTSDGKSALPNGLILRTVAQSGKLTCQITGTPDAVVNPAVVVSIAATNSANTDNPAIATVSIEVNMSQTVIAPSIAVTDGNTAYSFTKGTAITDIAFTNTGGAITACTIAPPISGLSINATSCTISGTPDTVSTVAPYKVTATNGTAPDSVVTLMIAVNDVAPTLQAVTASAVAAGIAITPVLISSSAGTPTACAFIDSEAVTGSQEVTTLNGLSIAAMDSSCQITGMLANTGEQSFTVRATNAAGSSEDVMVAFTVQAANLPLLVAPAAENLVVVVNADLTGTPITITNSITAAESAISANSCEFVDDADSAVALTNQVVMGFAISTGTNTCLITGTPDTVGSTAVRVRASGTNGVSNILDLTITVNDIAPNLPDATVAAPAFDGVGIDALTISNTGGEPANCFFFDSSAAAGNQEVAMLDGLTVAKSGNDCVVNGMLSGAGDQTFTVRARNVTGFDDAEVTFTVQAANLPSLVAPAAENLVVVVNADLTGTPITITNSVTAVESAISANSCEFVDDADSAVALTNQVVMGLAISTGTNTCLITGTPDTVGSTTVRVRASGTNGTSNILDLTITVNDAAPSITVTGGVIIYSFTKGTAITDIAFSNTGGAITGCAITPAISGLSINATSCTISGAPDTASTVATYTVTASNSNDSDSTLDLTITVNDIAPNLPDATVAAPAFDGVGIDALTISNTGGEPANCFFFDSSAAAGNQEVAMLDGLTVAKSGNDCVVNGMLSGAGDQTFTVRARNVTGFDDAEVTFTVQAANLPSLVAPAAENLVVVVNADLTGTPITITNSATAVESAISANSCEFVDDADSAVALTNQVVMGLAISTGTNTCLITGTPDTVGSTTVRVRASGTNGVSNILPLMITVNDIAPSITVTGGVIIYSFTKGTAITDIAFSNTGGAITGCAITPEISGLSINAASCTISGTPDTVSVATYRVTASNSNDSDSEVTLTITVNDAAPSIAVTGGVTTYSFTKGTAITDIAFTNTGGAITGCAITPAISGLSINATSCTISGTPDTVSVATYTVTASNSNDSDSTLDLTITVNDVAPSIAVTGGVTTYSFTKGTAITDIAFTNTGGAITACTIAPAISGLSINATSCTISGTPDTVSTVDTYRVTASNSNDSDSTLDLTITVNDAAPSIAVTGGVTTYSFTKGTAITDIAFSNTGGAITGCTIAPAISGLSINATSCTISGTPDTVSTVDTYRVTASNSNDSDSTLDLTITVNPQNPILPGEVSATATSGVPIPALTIPNTGGEPANCFFIDSSAVAGSQEVAMLNGLTVATSGNDCVVNGMLSGAGDQTFTVRARNVTGFDDAEVTFTVQAANLPLLVAPAAENLVVVVNADLTGTPITITNSATAVESAISANSCKFVDDVDPAVALTNQVVMGFAISTGTNTCLITGTPDTVGSTTVRVRASGTNGTSNILDLTITVNDVAPSIAVTGGVTTYSFTKGTAITDIAFTNTGGAITGCAITPSISGLSINATSCTISGTPDTVSVATYTVTASNSNDSDSTLDLTITVNDVAPSIAVTDGNTAYSFTKGTAITDIAFTNTGGAITGCAIAPTISGLSINATSCTISGTPDTVSVATYTVTASNSNDSDSTLDLTITVNDAAPSIAVTGGVTTYSFTKGTAITDIAFTNTGGAITACTIAPAISGLSINATSCTISGTPDTVSVATYTVTASNSNDSDSTLDLTITVNDAAPSIAVTGGVTTYSFTKGTAITDIAFTNTGGAITGCAIAPSISGLSINATSCTISGTPDTVSVATYTVTASNSNDSDSTLDLTITVNDVAPSIAVTDGNTTYLFTKGTAITDIAFTNTGGAITGCAIAPAISGLSVDPTSCTISGTPDTASTVDTYRVTASNSNDSDSEVTLTITVSPPATPPELSVRFPAEQSLTDASEIVISGTAQLAEGATLTSLTVSLNGGAAVDVTVTDEQWVFGDDAIEATTLVEDMVNTFVFTLTDSNAATDEATITVTHFSPPPESIPMTAMRGLALDAASKTVYVVDDALEGIYAVDLTTNVNRVFSVGGAAEDQVGTGAAFSDKLEGGIALDAANNRLLVTDNGDDNENIIAVSLASGSLGNRSVFSSATQTGPAIVNPFGIVVDSANNRALYVDTGPDAVIAVDLTTGNRTMIAELGSDSSARDLVLDATNNRVLVADAGTRSVFDAVRAVALNDGTVTVVSSAITGGTDNTGIGTGAGFGTSRGIVLDSTNNQVLVADSGGVEGIVAVDLATGNRTTLSGEGVGTSLDSGAAFNDARDLIIDSTDTENIRYIVADDDLDELVAVDPATGNRTFIQPTVVDNIPSLGTGTALGEPVGLVYDEENNQLFIADDGPDSIVSVDLATGNRTTLALVGSDGMSAALANPRGLGWSTDEGTLLVPDNSADAILSVDISTGMLSTLSDDDTNMGADTFTSPRGHIAVESDTTVLVADTFKDALFRVTTADDASTTEVDESGDREVVKTDNGGVLEGIQSVVFDNQGEDGGNNRALVVSGSATVDTTLDAVVAVALDDGTTTVLSSMAQSQGTGEDFSDPRGLAINEEDGNLLVLDVGLDALLSVDLDNGNREILSNETTGNGNLLDGAAGAGAIVIDADRQVVYVVTEDSSSVRMIDINSGDQVTISR